MGRGAAKRTKALGVHGAVCRRRGGRVGRWCVGREAGGSGVAGSGLAQAIAGLGAGGRDAVAGDAAAAAATTNGVGRGAGETRRLGEVQRLAGPVGAALVISVELAVARGTRGRGRTAAVGDGLGGPELVLAVDVSSVVASTATATATATAATATIPFPWSVGADLYFLAPREPVE